MKPNLKEIAKYLIFLDPAYRKNRVKKAKPVSRKIPIFPLENAWTEINTPERVMNVPNIVDKNIKQMKSENYYKFVDWDVVR